MAEPTHPAATETTPASTTYGYCSWHRGYAAGVRLIDIIEQGSGSGGASYACGPCCEVHRLTPYADRP